MTIIQRIRFLIGLRPGSIWEPDRRYNYCLNCGGNYNSHGADRQTALRLGIVSAHLICPVRKRVRR